MRGGMGVSVRFAWVWWVKTGDARIVATQVATHRNRRGRVWGENGALYSGRRQSAGASVSVIV
jgi:hypothetical protein